VVVGLGGGVSYVCSLGCDAGQGGDGLEIDCYYFDVFAALELGRL
jgi:hypothetical protein